MRWEQTSKYRFDASFDSGSTLLNRYVEYKNSSNTAISVISLSGFVDGRIQVYAKITNTELLHTMLIRTLPFRTSISSESILCFSTNREHYKNVVDFLCILQNEQPNLTDILGDIQKSLGVAFSPGKIIRFNSDPLSPTLPSSLDPSSEEEDTNDSRSQYK